MKSPFHLPKTVEIDGENYGIYTDFRTWIGFEIIMSSDIPHIEKCVKVLRLCYCQLLPKLDKAMEALIDFYSLVESSALKYASPSLEKNDYILRITVMGEAGEWFKKDGTRFGSDDVYVSVSAYAVK